MIDRVEEKNSNVKITLFCLDVLSTKELLVKVQPSICIVQRKFLVDMSLSCSVERITSHFARLKFSVLKEVSTS